MGLRRRSDHQLESALSEPTGDERNATEHGRRIAEHAPNLYQALVDIIDGPRTP